jgi:arsenical pump membrane protein
LESLTRVILATLPNALTFLVLLGTVALVVRRPPRLNEGGAATLGTVAVLLLGTATPGDVWRGAVDTAGILIFLIAMMLVATVAEEAGWFDWAAERAVVLSGGRRWLLFLNLYLFGAIVTLFLSLDVTAIMVAPIVCALVRRARLDPLPFVLACAYVANNASLFLPVSNLTNMLVYSLLGIPFWSFVRLMTLPNLAAMLTNVGLFFVLFRQDLRGRFALPADDASKARIGPAQKVAGLGLIAVVVGLVIFGALGLPLWIPALVGALVLAPLSLVRRDITTRRLVAGVAWPLPFFVIGMDAVVVAADRAGLGAVWGSLLPPAGEATSLGRLLIVPFGTALGANLVNNLPMALVAITGLTGRTGPEQVAPAFASLIGTNVGPNVTVFGSLATMLVLQAARRYGIEVRSRTYLVVGLLTTPPMIVAATTVLWLLSR